MNVKLGRTLVPAAHRMVCLMEEARLCARSALGPLISHHDSLPTGRGGGDILVLPGFMATDMSVRPLRRGLRRMGYRTHKLAMGRNRGVANDTLDRVDTRVRELQGRGAGRLILVGWSLGGLIAREYAKYAPDRVSAVITLGSPISADLEKLMIARVYAWMAGRAPDAMPIPATLLDKPPQPTVAIWSRRDGVIPRRHACGPLGCSDADIAVDCAHLAYPADLEVMRMVDHAIRNFVPERASWLQVEEATANTAVATA